MEDQIPITVDIVRHLTTGPSEGTETLFFRVKRSLEMSKDDASTPQEKTFRVEYAAELKKKHDNELDDERRRVNYQEGKTPGRRGEIIMQDEISKETIRRYYSNQKD
jgi:hypothetical protein